MTVQGHCNYIKSQFPERSDLKVIVANDVRTFYDLTGVYNFLGKEHPLLGVSSRSLGKLACEIYAANGIITYFEQPESDNALLSTPELSFLIGKLDAIGGINISASHNHPDDNGVKVYDEFGSQPVPPLDQKLATIMQEASSVKTIDFSEIVASGLVRPIPSELHDEYIENYVKLYGDIVSPNGESIVTFTPLCGCGLTTVGKVLTNLKFPVIVPPDQGPDGAFTVLPFRTPNPEVPQSTEPARIYADENNSRIVLSSDPDADRVGLEIKLKDGSWYHFDGNQIATVLCYYLMLDPRGPHRRGLVLETLVTTKTLKKIVDQAGDSYLIDDLLVGFKYVADILKKIEIDSDYSNLSNMELVIAAEESHGIIVDPRIRDKDAVPACMYLAALHQLVESEGKNLLDYYNEILENIGGFDSVNRSIVMTGSEGMHQKNAIMKSLRTSPPERIAGEAINKINDYWDEEKFGKMKSYTDELSRDVIQYFTDNYVITIRPSGTEPKLKFYCQLLPKKEFAHLKGTALLTEVRKNTSRISLNIYNDLLGKIDMSLSDVALQLPDIIDLRYKMDFDERIINTLRSHIENDQISGLDELLQWLKIESKDMTPGADPLPALKLPLQLLCESWFAEFKEKKIYMELSEWVKM